jgi:hypothetical protein
MLPAFDAVIRICGKNEQPRRDGMGTDGKRTQGYFNGPVVGHKKE